MKELVQLLMQQARLTEQQAKQAAETTKTFIQSKVPPQMQSVVDQFFTANEQAMETMKTNMAKVAETQTEAMKQATAANRDAGDKMMDFTHDAMDKTSEMAKEAGKKMMEWAHQAGDSAEDAMDKIRDFFSTNDDAAKK